MSMDMEMVYVVFCGFSSGRAGEPNDETLEVFQLAGTDVPPLLSSLRLTALDMSKQFG